VRIPGEETELFESFSNTPVEGERQVICRPWSSGESATYFFHGDTPGNRVQDIDTPPDETSIQTYSEAFKSCMSELQAGRLTKVVLSRVLRKTVSELPDLVGLFRIATSKYPDAFVYLVSHPTKGLWLGASPEILLKQRHTRLESVSLAGTQPVHNGNYTWGEKEKAEQAYVSDHIRHVLSSLNCQIEAELGPETVEAAKVAHLKTRFLFTSKEKIYKLLENLHPTPAIAGLPREHAIDFIDKTERHDRGLYTGYIGVYDSEKADIYVNLRCMQILSNAFFLYLGGGITVDSVLEKEWQETEYKAQTLLNLLDE
jgi:isochorismate synthase